MKNSIVAYSIMKVILTTRYTFCREFTEMMATSCTSTTVKDFQKWEHEIVFHSYWMRSQFFGKKFHVCKTEKIVFLFYELGIMFW